MKTWKVQVVNEEEGENATLMVEAADSEAARREAARKMGRGWVVGKVSSGDEAPGPRSGGWVALPKQEKGFKFSRVIGAFAVLIFLFIAAVFICGGLGDMLRK